LFAVSQLLGSSTGWQPHRVQPDRRHHILGDLDAVHVCSAGENRRERNAIGRVPFGRPLERVGMGLEESRLDVPHEWHVREIEPERGLAALVGMSMPAPGWRQHDITGRHIDPLTVHDGVDIAGGIEHETQGGRCVAMRARGLARLDHLVGGDDVARRGIGVPRSGVHHDEVAPLSDISADEAAGFVTRPAPRLHATRGLAFRTSIQRIVRIVPSRPSGCER
jgi:hypothetical protein